MSPMADYTPPEIPDGDPFGKHERVQMLDENSDLKVEVERLRQMNTLLGALLTERDRLITELCNVLEVNENAADFLGTGQQCRALIRRAREAVK